MDRIMSMKSGPFRLAPPTRNPSMSSHAARPSQLPGFTDPPYNTRVVAPASSLTVLLNHARMEAHAACACSVDATTPVPMAQIGS